MSDQELPEGEEWVLDGNGNHVYEDESRYRAYDEMYIQYYCENPELGKSVALKKAGFSGKCIKQKAWALHKRLLERIEKRLDDSILEGAHIGHSKLVHLCKESESETVQAKCAKDLIDFAGRKAGERITVTHEMSDEERDSEIIRLQAEIVEQEGNRKLDS